MHRVKVGTWESGKVEPCSVDAAIGRLYSPLREGAWISSSGARDRQHDPGSAPGLLFLFRRGFVLRHNLLLDVGRHDVVVAELHHVAALAAGSAL